MGIYQLNVKIDKLREDIVRMLGSKQDAINSAAKKSSDRHDTAAEDIADNSGGIFETAELASDNDEAIMDLADYVAELEERIVMLETKMDLMEVK